MTSHIYRAKFFAITTKMVDDGDISKDSIGAIVYFATIMKNKKRIIDGLAAISLKYSGMKWYQDSVKFYQLATVQYVSEAEKTGKFPVVNIPSCMPNVAAHLYKQHLMKDGVARSDADLFNKFFENLWVGQLRITGELKTMHKE